MNAMKNFVSGKHPALRLDQREGNFKKVISNLLRFKKIDCVRIPVASLEKIGIC